MSLEERMASLEAAIKELTAVVGGKKNSGDAKDAEPPKEEGRRRRSSKDDDDKGETRSRRSSKDDDKGDSKKDKGATVDDLRKAYGDWLGSEDDKGFDDRREFLEAVLDELGIDSLKNIKDGDIDAALYWLKVFKKNPGDKVDFNDRGDGDGGEGRGRRSSRRDMV